MIRHTLSRDPRNGNYYSRIQRGKVMKKFVLGRNRRKAEQALRKLEDDIERGSRSLAALANSKVDKTDPRDLVIKELVARYLAWVRENRALGTWGNKTIYLEPFLKRYGDCMVSDINHTTLAQYYAWARKVRGQSANGGNRHLREVKTLFRWGEEMDICACPVKRFPAIREAPARTRKFTDEEFPRLLAGASADFRDMVVFGLLTGLRPQELRGLKQEHIWKVGPHVCVVLERHKTSMSAQLPQPRCVPLSTEALAIVKRQSLAHPQSAHVFLNAKGRPYTAGGFRQRLERACARAGLEKRSPYALRHYFGTKQAGEGLNQGILAQLMGHTTIVTTSRYIARVPDYHQKAVDRLQESLSSLLSGFTSENEKPAPLRIVEPVNLRLGS